MREAALEFRILGPLEVVCETEPYELAGARQRITLATLLVGANKLVTMNRLLEAIYGDTQPSTSRSQVQIAISALRRLFADHQQIIVTHPNGYTLQIEDSRLDASRFTQLVAEARNARDPEEAVARYRDAHRLWRGPALHGLDSQVLEAAAGRLNELRIDVIETRIQLELGLGRHHELLSELAELVEAFPMRERLCGELMLALHNSGRTANALQVYQHARAMLIEKLGLEPGEPLQQLHRSILRADPALTPVTTAQQSPPAPPPSTPRLLPIDIGDFTGRPEQLNRIQRHLTSATPRGDGAGSPVMVLIGRQGVGKTALAVHASHLMSAEFPDGQLFIDLHGNSEHPVPPEEVLERLIGVLGPPTAGIPDGLEARAEIYRNLLAGQRVLIVLDDAASEIQVTPLLPGHPAAAVLITSRGRLVAFPDAELIEIEVFDADTSLDMLARILGGSRVRGQLEAAAAVTRHCGHLPLALRIAGARLSARPHWNVGHLADRLADEAVRLDELRYRDMSIREGFSLTYENAGQQEKRLFRRLAVLPAATFPGWVGAALLDQSVNVAERVLDDLADKQLIGVEEAGSAQLGRYFLPPLLRVFARERLPADDSTADCRAALKRMLGALLCMAEHARLECYGEEQLWEPEPAWWWPLSESLVRGAVRDPLAWCELEQITLASGVGQAAKAGFFNLSWRLALSTGALFEAMPQDMRALQQVALEAAGLEGGRVASYQDPEDRHGSRMRLAHLPYRLAGHARIVS